MRTQHLGTSAKPVVLAALFALAGLPAEAAAQAGAPVAAAAPNGVGSAFELTFWQSVTGSEDSASYEAYLARYPDGTFSGLARARIAALQRAMAVQPAAAPAIVAAPTPEPMATPAVLTMPQTAAPLAPTPAFAAASPAPAAPAAAPALAEAAPSPLTRLLAQLRGSSDQATPVAAAPAPAAESAPLVTTAPPVQQLPTSAPGLAVPLPAPVQPVYASAAPAAVPSTSYASARPLLLPVPDVLLPAYFCGNDARNAFHNSTYRPAVEIATRNNEAAVTYLRQLQQTYDRGQLGRDTAVLNAISAEARAYQSEAARAYSVQAALVHQFDALMALPLRTCALAAQ